MAWCCFTSLVLWCLVIDLYISNISHLAMLSQKYVLVKRRGFQLSIDYFSWWDCWFIPTCAIQICFNDVWSHIFGLALWFLNPGFFCLLALQGSYVLCIRFFLEVQYLQHTRLASSLTRLSTGSGLTSGVMACWGLGSFAGLDFTWNIRSWWGWPCCYLDWMLYQQPLWSNIHVWLLWHCPGGCLSLHA
jgi:hypothetical protein